MKNARHKKILELIESNPIQTQGELADLLRANGFSVTQTTVSRDIKSLELIKTLDGDGATYRYSVTVAEQRPRNASYQSTFGSSLVNVTNAANMVVVRTMPGAATWVAKAIDGLKLKYVLGAVAGYDTVMVVVSDGNMAQKLCVDLQTYIVSQKTQ